jgi:hypothetical protein
MITRIDSPFYKPTAEDPLRGLIAFKFDPLTVLPIAHQELPIARRLGKTTELVRILGGQPYPPRRITIPSSSPDASSGNPDLDPDVFIQKPEGEAGRPGRGRYNLEVAVGWSSKEYNQLRVRSNFRRSSYSSCYCYIQDHVHTLSTDHLDETRSFSKQSTPSMQLVRTLVSLLSSWA